MNQDELKKAVAQAALDYITPKLERDSVIGVGTGSTTNFFIDLLPSIRDQFSGTVASSEETARRLEKLGIPVLELNDVNELVVRSEEHTSELQSRGHLVCRLLLEKKKKEIERNLNKYAGNSVEHMTCDI